MGGNSLEFLPFQSLYKSFKLNPKIFGLAPLFLLILIFFRVRVLFWFIHPKNFKLNNFISAQFFVSLEINKKIFKYLLTPYPSLVYKLRDFLTNILIKSGINFTVFVLSKNHELVFKPFAQVFCYFHSCYNIRWKSETNPLSKP